MIIAVVSSSRALSNQKQVRLMVAACDQQLRRHAAPLWDSLPSRVVYAETLKDVPRGQRIISLLDTSDEADALGYHAETPDGRPYGRVFVKTILDNGGTLLEGANSVSVTLSHEVLEMWGDPNVNLWYDGPGDTGYSGELCDAVEGDCYNIKPGVFTTKVPVSNFVLPPYFDSNPAPDEIKFDYLGKLISPFSMTEGGYLITRKENGKVDQIYGSRYPTWKKPGKQHKASRTKRRTG